MLELLVHEKLGFINQINSPLGTNTNRIYYPWHELL